MKDDYEILRIRNLENDSTFKEYKKKFFKKGQKYNEGQMSSLKIR